MLRTGRKKNTEKGKNFLQNLFLHPKILKWIRNMDILLLLCMIHPTLIWVKKKLYFHLDFQVYFRKLLNLTLCRVS